MNIRKLLVLALVMLVPALLLQNCNDENPAPDPDGNSDTEYFGTQNPGDAWVTFFNNSASIFVMTWDKGTSLTTADDIIFKGPFQRLSNGYIKMTVTSTVPVASGIPTDGSMIFYAVEIPGRSLFIMPPSDSKLGLITMNARSTRTGTNGTTKFNYVRTAFPTQGYEHVTRDECWGKFEFNFNESAGTFSFGSNNDSKTLSCAENAFNPSVACQQDPVSPPPVGVTIGSISSNGALEQTAFIDGKKFTGQYTVSDGLLVMDNGEGSGGFIGIKEDPSAAISQFMGWQYIGFGSFFGRNEANTFFLSQTPCKMNTFTPDSAVITIYEDVTTDQLRNHVSYGLKFKSIDKGLLKGYLWPTDPNNEATGFKYPFVANTYNKNGKKIMVIVSGEEQIFPSATRGQQWVFEFVYN
jgi:hypothetical protein